MILGRQSNRMDEGKSRARVLFVQHATLECYLDSDGCAARGDTFNVVASSHDADWLARFHDGASSVLAESYHEHVTAVLRAVTGIVGVADAETVVHEVFYKLLVDADFRRSFHGGSLGAWLTTIARNRALNHARRLRREQSFEPATQGTATSGSLVAGAELRELLDQFIQDFVPDEWRKVFSARFVEQLTQREAAKRLGIHRTTLAYQELRLRQRLRKFVARIADK